MWAPPRRAMQAAPILTRKRRLRPHVAQFCPHAITKVKQSNKTRKTKTNMVENAIRPNKEKNETKPRSRESPNRLRLLGYNLGSHCTERWGHGSLFPPWRCSRWCRWCGRIQVCIFPCELSPRFSLIAGRMLWTSSILAVAETCASCRSCCILHHESAPWKRG